MDTTFADVSMVESSEEPLTIFRLSKVIFIAPVLVALVGFAVLGWLWVNDLYLLHKTVLAVGGPEIYDRFARAYPTLASLGRVISVFIAAILAGSVLARLIRYRTTELRVFPDKVLWRTGFIRRDVFTAAVSEVIGVQFKQTIIGRLLGYGTVMINTRGDDQIVAQMISGAPEASAGIMALKNAARR